MPIAKRPTFQLGRAAIVAAVLAPMTLLGCGTSEKSLQAASTPSTGPTVASTPKAGDPSTTSSAAATTTTATATKPGAMSVDMRLIAFRPEQLTVPAGTNVSWTQSDAGFHTVTSGRVEQGSGGVTVAKDNAFDSGRIEMSGTFSHRFDAAGTFSYFCQIHPATMRGEIRVV